MQRIQSTCPPRRAPSRRAFLSGLAALLAAGSLPAFRVCAAPSSPSTEQAFSTFERLSRQLTGREELDEALAKRLFAAFSELEPDFSSKLDRLDAYLAVDEGDVTRLQSRLDADKPDFVDVPKAIVTGWYLGSVGQGEKARVVAYEEALMFDPVDDVVVMPSYSRGEPGYWQHPPHVQTVSVSGKGRQK